MKSKATMMDLLPSFLHIINISLTTGTFPDALKHAKAIPPVEKRFESDMGNSRFNRV